MDQLDLILMQHARVHAAEVADAAEPTLEDRLLSGLSDDQLRRHPGDGMNSVAWLLWHMARIEDVTMNVLLAGRPQVLDEGWLERLNLSCRDVGTGMTDAEVAGVSGRVDVSGLRAYRAAVGRRTRQIIGGLRPDDLTGVPDGAHVRRLLDEGALGEQARWLATAWESRPKGFFLIMPATGHNYLHLGEAWCVRGLIERDGGR